jgi:hypothetical protein
MRERVWWVLVMIAALIAVFGLTDVLIGATADPGIAVAISGIDPETLRAQSPQAFRLYDFASRSQGMVLFVLGVLLLVVLLRPYRDRQPWAWAAAWVLPAWAVAVPVLYLGYGTQPDQPPAPPMVSGPIIAVIAAAVLLVDRRRFAT